MEIVDTNLGLIKLLPNTRAKRVIARVRRGNVELTYPQHLSVGEIKTVIEKIRPQLEKLKDRVPSEIIFSPQTTFKTFSFSLQMKASSLSKFYVSLDEEVLSVAYPDIYSHDDEIVQTFVRNIIEKVMRVEAKRILPSKVTQYAQMHGLEYTEVKISSSKGRWGSCSSRKVINLSYYSMLLPEYLIDFVILHELCHTIEMNHGEKFWLLLDKVSNGKAMEYTKELKKYRTVI